MDPLITLTALLVVWVTLVGLARERLA